MARGCCFFRDSEADQSRLPDLPLQRQRLAVISVFMRSAVSLLVALAGVGLFYVTDLPLPWLLGPMFACLTASLLGARLTGFPRTNTSMRVVLGVALGASLTPDLLSRMDAIGRSLLFVPPFMAVSAAVGFPYFRRLCGFDPATSYYAAMPGGLLDMLIFGQEAGGSLRALSLVHATRLLLIVSVLPFLLHYGLDVDTSRPPGIPAINLSPSQAAIMLCTGLLGWAAARRIGLFGAALLGPMIAAGLASQLGLITERPPAEAILAAQLVVGLTIGVSYCGITLRELRQIILAAIGYVLLLCVLSALVISLVIGLDLAPPLDAILAFSPGGQAEMAVLAIIAGADVAFVVTHHIARILIVTIGAPIVHKVLVARERGRSDP